MAPQTLLPPLMSNSASLLGGLSPPVSRGGHGGEGGHRSPHSTAVPASDVSQQSSDSENISAKDENGQVGNSE